MIYVNIVFLVRFMLIIIAELFDLVGYDSHDTVGLQYGTVRTACGPFY